MAVKGALYRKLKPKHRKHIDRVHTDIPKNVRRLFKTKENISGAELFFIFWFGIGFLVGMLASYYYLAFGSFLFVYFLIIDVEKSSKMMFILSSFTLMFGSIRFFLFFIILGILLNLFSKAKPEDKNSTEHEKEYSHYKNIKNETPISHEPVYLEKSRHSKPVSKELKEKQTLELDYDKLDDDIELPKLSSNFNTPPDPKPDVYSGYSNFDLFFDFICNTKTTLDIMTNSIDGKIFGKLTVGIIDKNIKIRVITRNKKEQAYLKKLMHTYKNIEIRTHPKIHAKLIIRDEKKMIIGSSNITDASLSETNRFYDVNALTEDKEAVKLGKAIFDSIWYMRDITGKPDKNNILLYSKNGDVYLPKCVLDFVKNEKKEVIMIMASGLIDKSIMEKIQEANVNVKKTIVTWKEWKLLDVIDDSKLDTIRYLINLSQGKSTEFNVLPKKSSIHAKVYIFRGQGFAIISSQNLTVSSWQSLFETGLIVRGKAIKMLLNDIKDMYDEKFDSINTVETEKPESTWQGTTQERKKGLPWELAEADSNWKVIRNRYENHHKILQKEINKEYNLKHDTFFSKKGKKNADDYIRELIKESQKEILKSKKRAHGSKEDYERSLRRWEEILKEIETEINPKDKNIPKIKEVIEWYKKE